MHHQTALLCLHWWTDSCKRDQRFRLMPGAAYERLDHSTWQICWIHFMITSWPDRGTCCYTLSTAQSLRQHSNFEEFWSNHTSNSFQKEDPAQPFALVHALQIIGGGPVKDAPRNIHCCAGCLLPGLYTSTHSKVATSPPQITNVWYCLSTNPTYATSTHVSHNVTAQHVPCVQTFVKHCISCYWQWWLTTGRRQSTVTLQQSQDIWYYISYFWRGTRLHGHAYKASVACQQWC